MSATVRMLLVATVLSLGPKAAVAGELADDSERVLSAWRAAGIRAERAILMFVEAGETRRITLPPAARRGPGCTTMVALASRGLRFSLQEVVGAAATTPPRNPSMSEAGVARISDCGRREPLRTVAVTGASPRGTVELLVAHGKEPPPPVAASLPTRAVGLLAPNDPPGEIAPAPLQARVQRAEVAARLAGAAHVVPVETKASSGGGGALLMRLGAGCHRIAVLAERSPTGAGFDLDAEVRLRRAPAALRRDRSHAPDARLDFCLGRSGPIELRYLGAPPNAELKVLDGFWPLQRGLPARWGHNAVAAMAWALHRRRLPLLGRQPERELLGGPGVTNLSFELDPEACYVAAYGVSRGAASGARISARVGDRRYRDDAPDVPRSGALSFCAEGQRQASVQVDVRSASAWWRLGLWRVVEGRP